MKLIGCAEAGRYLSISPELVRHRANAGHLRIARRSPLRFRVADVIAHAKTSTIRPYTRKPSAIDVMDDRLAQLLRNVKGH